MLFHVAGIEVTPLLPFAAGFTVALFCSMAGVSGANLLLPFQMSVLGFATPAVSATNHLFNIVAIPSGVYRFVREGRMVWPLAGVVIAGTVPGVILGVFLRIRFLPDPARFKIFAGLVLLYIGGMLVRSLLFPRQPEDPLPSPNHDPALRGRQADSWVVVERVGWSSIDYTFAGKMVAAPTLPIGLLSAVVGIVGGIYGIGGGALIAPVFVTLFRLPVHTIAGACLLGTFATSLVATAFYQGLALFSPELAVAPDWPLGILMGMGGMIGMYLGARLQKFVPAKIITWLLAAILVFTGLRYTAGLLF